MRSNSPTARRTGAIVALSGLALAIGGAAAGAARADAAPRMLVVDNLGSCNGVAAGNGSANTTKQVLPGSSTEPGGAVSFSISFPVDADDVGADLQITDCVVIDGTPVAKYVIDFVPNDTTFVLEYPLVIPADTPVGAEYCNHAKATGHPSGPPASNRKAKACFTVTEPAVEPTATATATVEASETPSVEPTETVSETPSEETASEEPSEEPTEEPTVDPSDPVVEPGDPEVSVSPTVKGVKIVRTPAAVPATLPTLPATGTGSRTLLLLGLAMVIVGGGLVLTGRQYQRQH